MKSTLPTTSWSKLPREKLRARQTAKLRSYLRDVVLPFHPHYREMFSREGLSWRDIRTLDDWGHVPFTSKSDLAGGSERTKAFVITPDPHQLAVLLLHYEAGSVVGVDDLVAFLEVADVDDFLLLETGLDRLF